jgi:hypothetical protein
LIDTNEIIIVTFQQDPPLSAGEKTKPALSKGEGVRGNAVSVFNAFVIYYTL